ncbi:MAG: hypothetical protein NTU80_03555 [Verrucomicrobia bacterium]|nr:hypothetical protein [Verrucomicrobiota bacterium]
MDAVFTVVNHGGAIQVVSVIMGGSWWVETGLDYSQFRTGGYEGFQPGNYFSRELTAKITGYGGGDRGTGVIADQRGEQRQSLFSECDALLQD